MKLDSEDQRTELLELLRQVPISLTDREGRPTLLTAGTLEDGPPDKIRVLLATIRNAGIEEPEKR